MARQLAACAEQDERHAVAVVFELKIAEGVAERAEVIRVDMGDAVRRADDFDLPGFGRSAAKSIQRSGRCPGRARQDRRERQKNPRNDQRRRYITAPCPTSLLHGGVSNLPSGPAFEPRARLSALQVSVLLSRPHFQRISNMESSTIPRFTLPCVRPSLLSIHSSLGLYIATSSERRTPA